MEHGKRQDQSTSLLLTEFPVTSSFDYWWPYPPALSSSELTTTLPLVSTETTPLNQVTGTLSSAGSTLVVAASVVTPTTSVSLSTSLSSNSSTSVSEITTITALPPLTSSSRPHPKATYTQPFNYLLLIPIFAVLSSVIGIACGWFGYGYWKRRRQARYDVCLVGPKYESIKHDEPVLYKDKLLAVGAEEPFDETGILRQPQLYKDAHTSDRDAELTKQEGASRIAPSWSFDRLSALQHPPLVSVFVESAAKETELKNGARLDKQPARHSKASTGSTKFSSVATSDEDGDESDESECLTIRESAVRHKSIRRRLADKLRSQFIPEYGFIRRKSWKQVKEREKTPEMEKGVLLQDDSLRTGSPPALEKGFLQRKKTGTQRGHGRAMSDFSVPIDGFQIPQKVYALRDPDFTPTSAQTPERIRKYSTPLKSSNDPSFDDKYTPLPARRPRPSPRKLISTRDREEVMGDSNGPPKFTLPGLDRRILPTSPPLLNWQGSGTALFFNSGAKADPMEDTTSPRREAARHSRYPNHDGGTPFPPAQQRPYGYPQSRHQLSKYSSTNNTATSRTSISPLDRSPLPRPLRRNGPRASSCSPTTNKNTQKPMNRSWERSRTAPSTPAITSPKVRHELRRGALDSIIERSWSARFLQEPSVRSDDLWAKIS